MSFPFQSLTGGAFIVVGGIFLGSCAAPTPMPVPHSAHSHPHFEQMDTNKDGRISYTEFSKSALAQQSRDPKSKFDRIDTNQDGYLSLAEMQAYHGKTKAKKQ